MLFEAVSSTMSFLLASSWRDMNLAIHAIRLIVSFYLVVSVPMNVIGFCLFNNGSLSLLITAIENCSLGASMNHVDTSSVESIQVLTPSNFNDESASMKDWSIDRVCAWMNSLQLGQYENAFRNNGINGSILQSLTEQDLEDDIGIVNSNHRRLIMEQKSAERCRRGRSRRDISNQSLGTKLETRIDSDSYYSVVDALTRAQRLSAEHFQIGDEVSFELSRLLIAADEDRPSFEVGERVAYFSEATSSFWCGKVLDSEPASEHYKLQTSPLQTQLIPAIDILRFQENSESPFQWKKGGAIGEGAFGSVLEAMDLRTGQRLAVKEIKIESHSKDSSNEELEKKIRELGREIAVMRLVSHPNVVKFLGTELDRENGFLYIFMELVSGGSISHIIREYGSLPENLIQSYTKQILLGLQYLHENSIAHRDLKGGNILVDHNAVVKLADFGAARLVQDVCEGDSFEKQHSIVGTPFWMAPEVVNGHGHGRKADVWSVGCTVIEMASGKHPWESGLNQFQALVLIAKSDRVPQIPDNLSDEGREFVKSCLVREPEKRPDVMTLLQHPWMQDML